MNFSVQSNAHLCARNANSMCCILLPSSGDMTELTYIAVNSWPLSQKFAKH